MSHNKFVTLERSTYSCTIIIDSNLLFMLFLFSPWFTPWQHPRNESYNTPKGKIHLNKNERSVYHAARKVEYRPIKFIQLTSEEFEIVLKKKILFLSVYKSLLVLCSCLLAPTAGTPALCVPRFRLGPPPGQANHTPKGKFVCTCTIRLFLVHAVLRRPSFFFSRFWRRGKQGCRRYITKHVWIPAELRGACSGC